MYRYDAKLWYPKRQYSVGPHDRVEISETKVALVLTRVHLTCFVYNNEMHRKDWQIEECDELDLVTFRSSSILHANSTHVTN